MVSDDEDEDFELHAAVAAVFLGGTPQAGGITEGFPPRIRNALSLNGIGVPRATPTPKKLDRRTCERDN
ncbi:hypothetical protein SCLCIDRAFT_22630 [Scleroderma citrinum Foug A]|uniref:Uncharacterized protein n=1 Tax=Scleroderma citrinum Foug A TaxID=1036808 RepID=A0A0C3EBU8_9AGAM|nr:hypothetical protein SCLCIDRAFT_22630 [Scleroderma citrinum Foug A]